MENIFEKVYNKTKELGKAYTKAKEENREDDLRIIKEAYDTMISEVRNKYDRVTKIIYRGYESSKENENEYIDFSDILQEKDVEKIVEILRQEKIKYFTYSSKCTNVIEISMLLKNHGCEIEDVIKINDGLKINVYNPSEYEKKPALLFKVN